MSSDAPRAALFACFAAVLAVPASPASAVLAGRDLDGTPGTFEAYYDDVLDVTWLADADLPASETFGVPGIEAQGGMSRATAQAWVAAMNAAEYLGYDDWRLPEAGPIGGGAHVYVNNANGTTDVGYALSAPGTLHAGSTANELAHLYYQTLANPPAFDETFSPTGCLVPPSFCLTNPGPFAHAPFASSGGGLLWTGTVVTTEPLYDGYGHFFDMASGFSGIADASVGNHHAWPVRDGDTIPVPEPASAVLLLTGVACLSAARRRA